LAEQKNGKNHGKSKKLLTGIGLLMEGVVWRLSADATKPSFVALLNYLNIRVTGVCEEFADA